MTTKGSTTTKATGLYDGTIEAEGYLRAMNLATEEAAYWLKLAEEPDDDG